MLETLLGGLFAILGGWGAIWFQLRNTRRNRMDEVTAERKVTANAQAYTYMKQIQSSHLQQDTISTLNAILSQEQWFFDNRLFLPGQFPEKWLSVRNDLSILTRWENVPSKTPEELVAIEKRIDNTISDAIDEIYKDMNLKRIDLSSIVDKKKT